MRDNEEEIEVPVALIGLGDHFALEVEGDSMIEAGIFDGDTVIIRKGEVAESGQIIVALVDENEVTLKRLRQRGQSIALEPANVRYETRIFPAERVKIRAGWWRCCGGISAGLIIACVPIASGVTEDDQAFIGCLIYVS